MRYAAVAMMLAGGVSAAPLVEPTISEPLTGPHQPATSIDLRAPVLAVPDDPAFAALAGGLRRQLGELLGVPVGQVPEREVRPGEQVLILFGNCFTGPVVRRLYANHLLLADGEIPGPGGFELRTIPDCLDYGQAIFLGASEPAGVARAVAALREAFASPPAAMGQLTQVESHPPLRRQRYDDAEIAQAAAELEQLLASFKSNKIYDAINALHAAATSWIVTGEPRFGQLYAALLEPTIAFHAKREEKLLTFKLPDLVMSVEMIDDCPGLPPDARLKAAEFVRQFAEDAMANWELSNPQKRYREQTTGPIWNHETHPSLGLAYAAQYLGRHYELPAASYWQAVVDHLFASQLGIDNPLEDSGGYQWSVHLHTAQYCLATGRLHEFLDGPTLRDHLAYAIGCHDSLGHEAPHGDVGRAFGSSAGPVLTLGAAIYRDPAYGFLLKLIGREPAGRLWNWGGEVPAAAPAEQVGLRTFLVHPARAEAFGITGLPADRLLDKAVFRSGWAPGDAYLCLDGLMVGNHKHMDANAIVEYTANRRRWLADADYIRAHPIHHNTIAVTRDGLAPDQRARSNGAAQVVAAPPFVAELVGQASGDGVALTRSTLHDYGGVNWERNIFWAAGNGFVVLDRLTAATPGDYLFRCRWRTLGEVSLDGPTVQVTQAGERSRTGEHLRVITDGDREVVELTHVDAAITAEVDLPAGEVGVAIEGAATNGSNDSLYLQLDDGELRNLGLTTDGSYPAIIRPAIRMPVTAGRHRLRLTLRERPGGRLDALHLFLPDGTTRKLHLADYVGEQVVTVDEPEQRLYIAQGTDAATRLSTSFDRGHPQDEGYYAEYPYAGKLTQVITQLRQETLAAGETAEFSNLFCHQPDPEGRPRELRRLTDGIWVANGREPLLIGLAPLNLDGLTVDAAAWLMTPDRLLTLDGKVASFGTYGLAVPQPGPAVQRFEGSAVDDARAWLQRRFAEAAAPQPVAVVHPNAAPGFEVFKNLLRPAAITALQTHGETIVTGDAAGVVTALTPDGRELWSSEVGGAVRTIARIDRGDEILWAVGSEAPEVVVLDDAGRLRWRKALPAYHFRTGAVSAICGADFDGDGRQELVVGSDNWHWYGFDAAGKQLWVALASHAATATAAGDLNGDGRDEVVAGTEYYWPLLLDAAGREMRRLSNGPVTTVAAVMRLAPDGPMTALIGAEDCHVAATQADGTQLWETNVGGTPTALVPYLDAGQSRLAVSTDAHGLALLDAAGERLGYVSFNGPVHQVIDTGERLAVACDDGLVYLLAYNGEIQGGSGLVEAPRHLAPLPDRRVVAAGGQWLAVLRTHDQIERTRRFGGHDNVP